MNQFRKEDVIDAGTQLILHIENERAALKNIAITRYQKPYKKYFFLGPLISLSKEEAIEKSKKYNNGTKVLYYGASDWASADSLYQEQYRETKAILRMANACIGNTVELTFANILTLNNYFEFPKK